MRSHNTSFFVFSTILSLSLLAGSLFYGGKVKAASPIFYDGSVTFYCGDRLNTVGSSDFQWIEHSYSTPYVNAGGVISDMWLLPASNDTTETFTNAPFVVSFNSQDLIHNGGKVFFSFLVAYSNPYYSSFSVVLNNITARRSIAGNVTLPGSGSTDLTITHRSSTADANSSFGDDFSSYSNPLFVDGFGAPTFDNFPVAVGKLRSGATSQLLHDHGLEDSAFYIFGSSANQWTKTYTRNIVVDVPAMNIDNRSYVVNIDLQTAVTGSFKSTSRTVYMEDAQGNFENVELAMQGIWYICPIYAFAVSNTSYEPIEYLLTNIDSNLSNAVDSLSYLANSPTSEQVAWLNEYQRKSQNAIAQASSMAAAAHYDFSRPDIDSGDLSQYITGEQVRPLTGLIQMFLSHSKILIILTIAVTASIIGYIFFGKRG